MTPTETEFLDAGQDRPIVRRMDDPAKTTEATLTQPTAEEQREVMRQWQRADDGMDGPRGLLPEEPDNPVAYKLLDAAGEAMERGEWQHGITILRLVVRDYRHSQEAACARQVIDRLTSRDR
jgi:hypothetical protein